MWKGIFVIVVTPFTDGHELDEVGLRRVVRFSIEAGAHGLVGPANASEFATLSDDERRRSRALGADDVCTSRIGIASLPSRRVSAVARRSQVLSHTLHTGRVSRREKRCLRASAARAARAERTQCRPGGLARAIAHVLRVRCASLAAQSIRGSRRRLHARRGRRPAVAAKC